jgi:hypothetical protein
MSHVQDDLLYYIALYIILRDVMSAPSDGVTEGLAAEGPVDETDRRCDICDIEIPLTALFHSLTRALPTDRPLPRTAPPRSHHGTHERHRRYRSHSRTRFCGPERMLTRCCQAALLGLLLMLLQVVAMDRQAPCATPESARDLEARR